MCDTLIDMQLKLFEHRRDAYESEAKFWEPEHTQEAFLVNDFQEFLATGAKYWEQLCRIRDSLLGHAMQCEEDHQRHFQSIDGAMKKFLVEAEDAESMLLIVERNYDVGNAEPFRTALGEARIFLSGHKDLESTRTPVSEWK